MEAITVANSYSQGFTANLSDEGGYMNGMDIFLQVNFPVKKETGERVEQTIEGMMSSFQTTVFD